MCTQCTPALFRFHAFGRRQVIGRFDDGRLTTDAGGLLVHELDLRLGLRIVWRVVSSDRANTP